MSRNVRPHPLPLVSARTHACTPARLCCLCMCVKEEVKMQVLYNIRHTFIYFTIETITNACINCYLLHTDDFSGRMMPILHYNIDKRRTHWCISIELTARTFFDISIALPVYFISRYSLCCLCCLWWTLLFICDNFATSRVFPYYYCRNY